MTSRLVASATTAGAVGFLLTHHPVPAVAAKMHSRGSSIQQRVAHVGMESASTVDHVIANMMARLRSSQGPCEVVEENLRLFRYPDEVCACLAVYREDDGSEWAQLRIGYIFQPLPPKHLRRLDFKAFLEQYQSWGEPITNLVCGCLPLNVCPRANWRHCYDTTG